MKKRSTRVKILEASLKVISRKGYLGATTREIAEEAGVAELTLFRHFTSKEGLFDTMLNEFSFLADIKGLLPELIELPYRDALMLVASKFLQRLVERRDLVRVLHCEVHLYPSKIRSMYNAFMGEVHSVLAGYLETVQVRGKIRKFDPVIGARAFMGMFFSHAYALNFLSRSKARQVDNEEVVRQYVDMFIRGTMDMGRSKT